MVCQQWAKFVLHAMTLNYHECGADRRLGILLFTSTSPLLVVAIFRICGANAETVKGRMNHIFYDSGEESRMEKVNNLSLFFPPDIVHVDTRDNAAETKEREIIKPHFGKSLAAKWN